MPAAKGSPAKRHGTVEFADGSLYEGQLLDREPNGFGRYSWAFVDRERDDSRVLIESYTGDWKDNLKSGYGIEEYASGARYAGTWLYGKRHGVGVYMWPGGECYEGEYRGGKRHGVGVYTHGDQIARSEAEWHNGIEHGLAMFWDGRANTAHRWINGIMQKKPLALPEAADTAHHARLAQKRARAAAKKAEDHVARRGAWLTKVMHATSPLAGVHRGGAAPVTELEKMDHPAHDDTPRTARD